MCCLCSCWCVGVGAYCVFFCVFRLLCSDFRWYCCGMYVIPHFSHPTFLISHFLSSHFSHIPFSLIPLFSYPIFSLPTFPPSHFSHIPLFFHPTFLPSHFSFIHSLPTHSGFSKESQKLVQLYRTKERFEPSLECEALVNAKFQSVTPSSVNASSPSTN